jgi:hypothetical protein
MNEFLKWGRYPEQRGAKTALKASTPVHFTKEM